MKIKSLCILLLCTCFTLSAEQDLNLYMNQIKVEDFEFIKEDLDFKNLSTTLSDQDNKKLEIFHIVENVKDDVVILQDGSEWTIGWWYTGEIKKWNKGNRLKISYHDIYSNNIFIQNIDASSTAWGTLTKAPSKKHQDCIARIPNENDPDVGNKIVLKSGYIFLGPKGGKAFTSWRPLERIFILHDKYGNGYSLWNFDKKLIQPYCNLISSGKANLSPIPIENIIDLEERLNKRVLAQPLATNAVVTSILNYCAGLKNSQTPIGVFLFLGPTGVGKTELAKALTEELYKDKSRLVRFDMSHFTNEASITRLIGSDPGYVNHEEGGQLTEAIKSKTQCIVLLDEIEKAHPAIRTVFLPVFDEGFLTDTKGQKNSCSDIIFIMTSNLCAKEILESLSMGLDPQDVLSAIEPQIMNIISPELYNRTEAILFSPLGKETMNDLVDLMLKDVQKRLLETKQYHVLIDQSAKDYLITNGYHPKLGARPLKKLIEKKVVASISYVVIKNQIPEGSTINVSYSDSDDSWHVSWF